MIIYDKNIIKEQLILENIYDLLKEWNAEPEYCPTGIISKTICHNTSDGSHKLYYYENSHLFQCYTNCGFFDIFELCIKVLDLQYNLKLNLNDAVRYIAQRFGLAGREEDAPEIESMKDWEILANYSRIKDIKVSTPHVILEEYDDIILSRFNYNVKIMPWLKEGISQQVLDHNEIGFYPGDAQITIPHFDKDGRFIGLRGRAVVKEDAEKYGKYRPVKVNNVLYNHPLGLNLYNFNNSRCVIPRMKKAIVFEGELSPQSTFPSCCWGFAAAGDSDRLLPQANGEA